MTNQNNVRDAIIVYGAIRADLINMADGRHVDMDKLVFVKDVIAVLKGERNYFGFSYEQDDNSVWCEHGTIDDVPKGAIWTYYDRFDLISIVAEVL